MWGIHAGTCRARMVNLPQSNQEFLINSPIHYDHSHYNPNTQKKQTVHSRSRYFLGRSSEQPCLLSDGCRSAQFPQRFWPMSARGRLLPLEISERSTPGATPCDELSRDTFVHEMGRKCDKCKAFGTRYMQYWAFRALKLLKLKVYLLTMIISGVLFR